MKQVLHKLGLVLGMALILFSGLNTFTVQAQQPKYPAADAGHMTADLQFAMLDENKAWVLVDDILYFSYDATRSWMNITPAEGLHGMTKVYLHQNGVGTILSVTSEEHYDSAVVLRTENYGQEWKKVESNLQFALSDSHASPVGELYSQWLSPQEGWLMAKKATGTQFSQGVLLYTKDGGAHWTALPGPNGERFAFLNTHTGFIQKQNVVDGFYYTIDGGKTWQDYNPVGEPLNHSEFRVNLPKVLPSGGFLLPVEVQFDEGGRQVGLIHSDSPSLNINIEKQFNIVQSEIREQAPQLDEISDGILLRLDLDSLSFLNRNQGWALFEGGECQQAEQDIACRYVREIKRTDDGAKSWQPVLLPNAVSAWSKTYSFPTQFEPLADQQPDESGLNAVSVGLFKGQGFDACEIPTLSQLHTWFSKSPYRAVNLYIGGISRYCDNAKLNKAYITEIARQGWRFIPTWVGHQAPCTSFRYPFPYDINQAYGKGVENANQAKVRMQEYGLLDTNNRGGVIYLDLEHFDTSNAACVSAARAYVKGWTVRLKELGILPGLYASSRSLNLAKIYNISPVVSAVWIAEWSSTPGFNPNASPYNLKHLPNGYWSSGQRIRQYSGGSDETWGNVKLNIDPNVADGKVLVLSNLPPSKPFVWATIKGEKGIGSWYKSQVNVTIGAVDYDSGIQTIYYKTDAGTWKVYQPFGLNGSGKRTVSFYAVSKSGRKSDVESISFYVDNQPPTNPKVTTMGCVAFDGVPQGLCNNAFFRWSGAADAGVGLNPEGTYQVYWGTNPNGVSNTSQKEAYYNPPAVPAKTPYYLRIRTQDKHNIWSAWKTLLP